jgi:hypothetical protein
MNGAQTWLQFRVGGQTHALDAAAVRQILRQPRLLQPPLAPAICPGWVAWQGRPLPVLDLGACLSRRPSVHGDARYLVWTQAEQGGVLAVDAVGALLHVPATVRTQHWTPVAPGLPPPWSAICGLLHADPADALDQPAVEPVAVFDPLALWQVCLFADCRAAASAPHGVGEAP